MARLMIATVDRAGKAEGHFASRKMRAVKSMKVNMAEGPSTTTTSSNQFVVPIKSEGGILNHVQYAVSIVLG